MRYIYGIFFHSMPPSVHSSEAGKINVIQSVFSYRGGVRNSTVLYSVGRHWQHCLIMLFKPNSWACLKNWYWSSNTNKLLWWERIRNPLIQKREKVGCVGSDGDIWLYSPPRTSLPSTFTVKEQAVISSFLLFQ